VLVTVRVASSAPASREWRDGKARSERESLFAVPFGEARLAACDQLNQELEALFLQRENAEHRNPTPATYRRRDLRKPLQSVSLAGSLRQELRRFMLDAVARM